MAAAPGPPPAAAAPAAPIDFGSLSWTPAQNRKRLEAALPRDQVEAFVEGEGQRLNTRFTQLKRTVAGGASDIPSWVRPWPCAPVCCHAAAAMRAHYAAERAFLAG